MPTFNDGQILTGEVTPLFVESMVDLKSRLRLSGAAAEDALEIIDFTVQRVRVGFYSRLSASRIDAIRDTSPVLNPTTREETIRTLAIATEIAWCRLILMTELPQLYIDGSGNTQKIWNEEGLTREGVPNKEKEMQRLWNQILDALAIMESGELSAPPSRVSLIAPDCPQPRPGTSIGRPWTYPTDRLRNNARSW